MENLIYILIGIAWVGYSLYSARQKAFQKQQSAGLPPAGPSQSSPLPIPGNQSGGKGLFDDILRELSGETRPVPQVQKPIMPINQGFPGNNADISQKYEKHSESDFLSSIPTESPRSTSTMVKKSQPDPLKITKEIIVTKKFNLRDAVIYSELLNKKYF